MERPVVRMARPEDEADVRRLAEEAGGFPTDFSWAGFHPYWLVAEERGRIVAAMQIQMGVPVARLDYLHVDPALEGFARSRVVVAIHDMGLALLERLGCEVVGSYISEEREDDFRGFAVERGWRPSQRVTQMVRRARPCRVSA